jgi:hypothetical protein
MADHRAADWPDRPEQVVQVRDRQRHLAVGARSGRGVVDAQGAVDDRIFTVGAQVDERHRRILGGQSAA